MKSIVPYRAQIGYEFPIFDIEVNNSEQTRLHQHCNITVETYGKYVDPTFIARTPITLNTQMIQASYPGHAPVHIVHQIEQKRPILLGEKLKMRGRVVNISAHRKGLILTSVWEYQDIVGDIVYIVRPDVLVIDQNSSNNARLSKEGQSVGVDFQSLMFKRCTPETTRGYCEGSTNKIHFDPETARRYGFRAPIIAGNQTVNFLMQGACVYGLPKLFSVEVRFLRPVFWDDTVEIQTRTDGQGGISAVRALNSDGKVVAHLNVLAFNLT